MDFTRIVILAGICTLMLTVDASAQGRRSRRWAQQSFVNTTSNVTTTGSPYTGTAKECDDALDEVNALRKSSGLPPFIKDGGLTKAALEAARRRASRLLAGHLPEGDFRCLPDGVHAEAAGCAAWEPSWGWGSCCSHDNYKYAGAAWVMGSDGRRYMHLFCRN